MTFDLMQWADEEVGEGGGGNFICQFSLSAGFLVYSKGERSDRYFPAGTGVDAGESKHEAKALAEKLTEQTGNKVRYNPVVSVYLYKDSVLNREVNWRGEFWSHDVATWTDAYTQVLRPSIEAALGDDLEPGKKYWGHIGLKPDPYQRTGSTTDRKNVPYIVQVFESKEDALAALDAEGTSEIPPQPDKWDEGALGQWNVYAEDVIKHFKENPDSDGVNFIVPPFGVDQDMLNKFRRIAEEESIPF